VPASEPIHSGSRVLAGLCLLIIAALLVVGAVSHGVLRHMVQTSPLWLTIILGARGSAWSKWTALPCFAFWLFLMTAIWLFLLGWAHIVSGTFSPTEIAMTVIVGVASIAGLALALFTKGNVRAVAAAAVFLLVGGLQIAAIWTSLLPQIAHR
jgi:hypothetical protein